MRGTGEYDKFYGDGIYNCAGCGTPLYKSTTKFKSGCGWPAFYEGFPGAINRTVSSPPFSVLSPCIPICLLIFSNYTFVLNDGKNCVSAGPRWEENRDYMCSLRGTFRPCFQGGGILDAYRRTPLCQQRFDQVCPGQLLCFQLNYVDLVFVFVFVLVLQRPMYKFRD